MLVNQNNIHNYIPQAGPFVLIDNLISASNNVYTSTFLIQSDNLFLDDDCLREFALIENMGQTALAGLAYLNQNDASSKTDGFLGGVNKLTVYELPQVNSMIESKVLKKVSLGNMHLFYGQVFCNKLLLMEGEIQLASN